MYQYLENINSMEGCNYKASVLVELTEAEQEGREVSMV
jgi:hypothetical protein